MKQRILSLFLAVLMIVSAVPMLLLPVVAAGTRESFTTSLEPGGENWPQIVDDGSGAYISYVGNWTAGVITAGSYREMNKVNENQYLTVDGLQWGDAGVFIFQKTGRGALLGASALDWPGDGGSNEAGTGPGAYYSELNSNRNKSALAYTYTVPYEGLVDLSIIGISMDNEKNKEKPLDKENGEIHQAYFAIFVNDKMVWPVAGGDVTDPADFALYPQASVNEDGESTIIDTIEADALKNIPVQCGDQIRFVTARYNARYTKFKPTVTFQEGYNIAPSTLSATYGPGAANWPQTRPMSGAGRLTQEDAYWRLGNFDVTTNTFTPYAVIRRDGPDTWVSANKDACDPIENNGVMIVSSATGTQGAYMFGSAETNLRPAYQYTAIATGKADLVAADVVLYDNENFEPVANASATLVYYLNGEEIGRAAVTSDANAVATVAATPAGVDVVKGDTIAIVALPGEGAAMLYAQPVVNYTEIRSFIAGTAEGKYVLSMETESIIVGDKIGIRFAAFATRDVYQDSDEGLVLRIWDANVEGEKTVENAATVKMTLKMDEGYAYVCEYDAIAPKQMTDTITIQAYATVDGEEICASEPKEISLADIAYAQYLTAVAEEDEKTAKTMAAVLNYGAAAQKYFDYRVDDLANKNLPAEAQVVEKKEDGYYSASEMDTVDPFGEGAKGNRSSSEITSVSLIFDSTLAIRVYVDVTADEVDCPITVRTGRTKSEMMDVRVGTTVDGANSFILTDIGLADLSKTQYFQVLVKHEVEMMPGKFAQITYQGNIFTYSVEAYVARMAYNAEKPELGELLHALMALSACVAEA